MLYMCFHIGEVRYAIQATSIESVIPHVNLQPCTELNSKQSGSLLYKQQLLPVFDLCQILRHRPAEPALSTRILILTNDTDSSTVCGIIVEQATGTISLDEVLNSPQHNPETPSLTDTVHTDSNGTLQLIKLPQLMEILLGKTMRDGSQQHAAYNDLPTGPTR